MNTTTTETMQAWAMLDPDERETLDDAYEVIRAWNLDDIPDRLLTTEAKRLYFRAQDIYHRLKWHYRYITLESLANYNNQMIIGEKVMRQAFYDQQEQQQQLALLPMKRKMIGHKKTG